MTGDEPLQPDARVRAVFDRVRAKDLAVADLFALDAVVHMPRPRSGIETRSGTSQPDPTVSRVSERSPVY
jgi:hypothetical protein